MKLKIASLFIALSCYASAEAQTQLSDYRPGVTTEGAVYFLPKTAIKVKVLVERSVYKPGEFCNYAMRYLHANDVQLEANTSYRIVSVKQQPIAMVDSTKAYAVKFNAKTIAANVSLSDDGRLLAINAQPTPQPEVADFKPAAKTVEVNPRKFMNEEILAAGSTAKMAELTAQEIYDLRENRALLIKGQADFMPSDGAQMKMMLDQIELQGNALTSLFTGTVNKDTIETTLTVIPDGALKHQILFRLSQRLGIVDADFEHILHKDKVPPNVIVTDCHDMEMLTLKSQPDMNSIYAELANPMLIKKYEEENSKIFIESIIDIAFEIGICKLVCINRNQYSRLNTQNLDYRDFVDRMLNIDIDKLILQVVRGNPGKGVSEFDISNQISSEKEKKHDRYQICCGHDVTNILELCFSQYGLGFGNENCLNTSRIESLLRTAYTSESFKKTNMYKKILEWEEKNNIKILDRMKIPD